METPVKLGDYYLFERIAVGGMAEVFKAATYGVEAFERVVAVKRVLPSIAEDHEFIDMFIDEAKIAVQLSHANIGQVFELGNAENSYFIAMEYVSGRDARAVFDRSRSLGNKLDVAMCCHVVKEVCEALDYAHNKHNDRGEPLNLIHRDVSPQNVLISYEGEVKLIDFGIAKAAGKASKTQSGILKGKFGYMSPEQLRGKPIDRRSDIFSLGTVLYELLTGERCFQGPDDFSVLEKVRKVDFRRPTLLNRMIPPELERIIYRSLTRDPDDRFQTASALKDELQKFLYQSGSFYSRRELADFMQETFSRDLHDSKARLVNFRKYARDHIGEARRPGSLDGSSGEENRPTKGSPSDVQSDTLGVTDRSTQEDPSDAVKPGGTASAPSNPSSQAKTIPYGETTPRVNAKEPTRRLVWLGIITILAVAAGLVTVFYALEFFGPSRVFLRTDPAQVSIYLDDKFRYEGQTPVELNDIAPGEHFLVIKAPGYKTRRERLNLDRGRELSLRYQLEAIKDRTELVIESVPGGATVYVDGKRLDESPIRTNSIAPGAHLLRVEKRGFLPWQGQVNIIEGNTTRPPKIRLYPESVTTTFVTEPREARVVIDEGGNRRDVPAVNGKKVVTLKNTGAIRLMVSAVGYASMMKRLPKLFDEEHTEFVALERISPKTRTSKAPVQPSPIKTSPAVAKRKKAPRSRPTRRARTPAASNSNLGAKEYTPNAQVTVTQGKVDKPGYLKILSQPPAIAYVNGKNLGWTPIIRHALGAGRHAIMLVRETAPKFRKSMLVNIEPGRENFQRYVHPTSR